MTIVFKVSDNLKNKIIEYYKDLIGKYPVISIEDGVAEEDWNGWRMLTEALGNKIQLVKFSRQSLITSSSVTASGKKSLAVLFALVV